MTIERIDAGDGPALHRLRTTDLTLVFAPDVGGRLISLAADDRELLWRNPAFLSDDLTWALPRRSWPDARAGFDTWANVGGGKTWPAPQGWTDAENEWPGPPDPVLDAGAYSWDCVDDHGSIRVGMRSPFDHRTGLRIERCFEIPQVGRVFEERIIFTNESERPRTWSSWEVVQVDSQAVGARTIASATVATSDDRVADLGSFRGSLRAERRGGHSELVIAPGVAKLGFPSATGTVAYREEDEVLLELSFTPEAGAAYPDGGSRVELWVQSPQAEPIAEVGGLHPTAWLIELEVLSPLRTLAPGESAELRIGWRVGDRLRARAAMPGPPPRASTSPATGPVVRAPCGGDFRPG